MKRGQEFTGQLRQLTMARILALSGGVIGGADWPRKNLHTDKTKAAEAGLPAPIASGIQCEGDIIRLLIDVVGERWFTHGKLSVTHRRPVFADTWVQAHAQIRGTTATDSGDVVEFEVWCETPEKLVVTSGKASCLIER